MRNFVFISPHFPDCYWKFVKALKERGWNILGIGDSPYHELSEEVKEYLTEYYLCPYMDDFENEKKAVEYFKNKYGEIDYLESNNEYWLEKDAELREIFNVKYGPRIDEVIRHRSKSSQKEFFLKATKSVARFCLPLNRKELEEFIDLVGYPVFAKPDKGVGSFGTLKIENDEDIDKFFELKGNQKYIVEEFIDGDLYSYDGVSDSKGNVLFATQNVFLNSGADIINDNLDDSYYCNPNPEEDFLELGAKIVKSMELKNRFFHIELFRLKKDHKYLGKKGTLVPLEANVRPAWWYTPDMINYANSLSCYNIYADSVTYDYTNEKLDNRKYICIESARRYNLHYKHDINEIIHKYKGSIMMIGDFPESIRDDMGDSYIISRFNTLEDAFEFDQFVREKE